MTEPKFKIDDIVRIVTRDGYSWGTGTGRVVGYDEGYTRVLMIDGLRAGANGGWNDSDLELVAPELEPTIADGFRAMADTLSAHADAAEAVADALEVLADRMDALEALGAQLV